MSRADQLSSANVMHKGFELVYLNVLLCDQQSPKLVCNKKLKSACKMWFDAWRHTQRHLL